MQVVVYVVEFDVVRFYWYDYVGDEGVCVCYVCGVVGEVVICCGCVFELFGDVLVHYVRCSEVVVVCEVGY